MAIFTAGSIVGQVSGRVAGNIFSHNKGGPYIRNGSIPTTSTTPDAYAAKGRLTAVSQAWQALTLLQRLSWGTFAQNNPTQNALGRTIHLTGHMWHVRCNTRLLQAGEAAITDAPADVGPLGLTSIALEADIGAGDVQITFLETPTAAADMIRVFAYVSDSLGVNYVKNLLRLVTHSTVAQASPLIIETPVIAKFGTLSVGQVLHVAVEVLDVGTGLTSSLLTDSAVVVSTV